MEKTQPPASPRWGSMTKLVVSLTLVVVLGALLVRFKFIIAPVLMAFVVAYLLFPLASQDEPEGCTSPGRWRSILSIWCLSSSCWRC